MWKLWIVAFAYIAMNIALVDAQYPCTVLRGQCIDRKKNCCPDRMTDGSYYCGSADSACCLPTPKTFHYQHPGGSGGGGTGGSTGTGSSPVVEDCYHHGGICVPTKDDCNCTYVDPSKCTNGVCCLDYPCGTRHVDGMCFIKHFYARRGNTGEFWTPLHQVPDGCYGKRIVRDPACAGNSHGCIRHKILNLLECMKYACPPVGNSQLSVEEFIGLPDLCDGKGVIIVVPDRCYNTVIDDLKQMCVDVGGTPVVYAENNEWYIKCKCY